MYRPGQYVCLCSLACTSAKACFLSLSVVLYVHSLSRLSVSVNLTQTSCVTMNLPGVLMRMGLYGVMNSRLLMPDCKPGPSIWAVHM